MGKRKKINAKKPKTHRKGGNKSVVTLFVALVMMCLSVLFALSLTVFFKTQSITVKGESIYTNEQIISASGMSVGKNMFVSMFAGASRRIETILPYVGDAKIDRNFDGNVVIDVKPAVAEKVYLANYEYIVTDKNGKVLDLKNESPSGLPIVSGVAVAKNNIGYSIEFTDKTTEAILENIFKAAEFNGLQITAIDTDLDYSFLDVVIGDKYLVHLLDENNIDYKLLHIKTSILAMTNDMGGVFTFSSTEGERAIFTPGDIHSTENEESEPETDITGTTPETDVNSENVVSE